MKISGKAFKKPLLASAMALAGFGMAGQAQAVAVAYSSVQLFNFSIAPINGAIYTPTPNARQTQSNAAFPGYLAESHTVGVTNPATGGSDVVQSTSGPGTFPGQNVFSSPGTTNVSNLTIGTAGARGDARTEVVAGAPVGATSPINVQNVSEVRLDNINGSAQGGSENSNSATLGIVAVTGPIQSLELYFDTLVRRYASTTELGEYAYAATNVSFTLTLRNPNGGTGPTIEMISAGAGADYGHLTGQCFSAGGSAACDEVHSFSTGTGNYFTLTPATTLAAGLYDMSLNISSSANARDVPEPATLSLLGAALLGLAAARRPKSKAQDQVQA